jgi:hypothetical protein
MALSAARSLLPPLPVTEVRAELATVREQLAEATRQRRRRQALLRIHEQLMQATATTDSVPTTLLTHVATAVAALPDRVPDSLPPRPRTAFRLLRAEAFAAAWLTLSDNAAGVVADPPRGTTSSGASAARPKLPLPTRLEDGAVYAWLPGFRDPRFAAPDDCYDISALVSLRVELDDVELSDTALTVSGSASLTQLPTEATDDVRLVLTGPTGEDVSAAAVRHRRPDLVTGVGEGITRLAWAGFSATLALGAVGRSPGSWRLSATLSHAGVVRSAPVGGDAGELARRALTTASHDRRTTYSLTGAGEQWELTVSRRPSLPRRVVSRAGGSARRPANQ